MWLSDDECLGRYSLAGSFHSPSHTVRICCSFDTEHELAAAVAAAYNLHRPVLAVLWQPMELLQQLDMARVPFPELSQQCWHLVADSGALLVSLLPPLFVALLPKLTHCMRPMPRCAL